MKTKTFYVGWTGFGWSSRFHIYKTKEEAEEADVPVNEWVIVIAVNGDPIIIDTDTGIMLNKKGERCRNVPYIDTVDMTRQSAYSGNILIPIGIPIGINTNARKENSPHSFPVAWNRARAALIKYAKME